MIHPSQFFRDYAVAAHGLSPLPAQMVAGTAGLNSSQRWRVLGVRFHMTTNLKATDGLDHYIGIRLEDSDGYLFADVVDFVKGATARPYYSTPWMTLGPEGSIGRQAGSALYLRQPYATFGALVDGFVGVDFVARVDDG